MSPTNSCSLASWARLPIRQTLRDARPRRCLPPIAIPPPLPHHLHRLTSANEAGMRRLSRPSHLPLEETEEPLMTLLRHGWCST